MSVPADRKYTKDHEWLLRAGVTAKVGITAHAEQQLGDVVFVDLPAVGARVTAGAAFGTVESVKAVSDLFAPLSGKVVAVNEELTAKPELINQDPFGVAWLIELAIDEGQDEASLLSAADYEALLATL